VDPLDWFSLAGRILPRLVAVILVVAFIGFPRTADAVFMWAVHARAAQITSELDHALNPMLACLRHHPAHERPSAICQSHRGT
jgi:hypothetical protein